MLTTVNCIVSCFIAANIIVGIWKPLVTIICSLIIILSTLIMNIFTHRSVNVSFKAIGQVSLNKWEIYMLVAGGLITIVYWSILFYAQIELVLMA